MKKATVEVPTSELVSLYESGLTDKQIAVVTGMNWSTIRQRLQKSSVKRRPGGVAPGSFSRTPEYIAYMDGLLLGDGCIFQNRSKHTPRYTMTQSANQRQWVNKISKDFEVFGIHTRTNEYDEWFDGVFHEYETPILVRKCSLNSKSFTEFRIDRDRWYEVNARSIEKGRIAQKVIPYDVDLSPVSLANWYMGDGSRVEASHGIQVKFYTNDFTVDEVEFLITRLKTLYGWSPTLVFHKYPSNPDGVYPVICMSRGNDIQELFEIVTPLISENFVYKVEEYVFW